LPVPTSPAKTRSGVRWVTSAAARVVEEQGRLGDDPLLETRLGELGVKPGPQTRNLAASLLDARHSPPRDSGGDKAVGVTRHHDAAG